MGTWYPGTTGAYWCPDNQVLNIIMKISYSHMNYLPREVHPQVITFTFLW